MNVCRHSCVRYLALNIVQSSVVTSYNSMNVMTKWSSYFTESSPSFVFINFFLVANSRAVPVFYSFMFVLHISYNSVVLITDGHVI
jgi:hypothetical protein